MAQIRASQSYRDFLKRHEGFSAVPYDDGVGNITIGYGQTGVEGMTSTTKEQAESMMESTISSAENELSSLITRDDLTPSQQDVLVDMVYNIGTTTLTKNGFFDKVNSGDDGEVIASISQYTKAEDKKSGKLVELGGLVKRSRERSYMWSQGMKLNPDDVMINSVLDEINTTDLSARDFNDEVGNRDVDLDAISDEVSDLSEDEIRKVRSGLDFAQGINTPREVKQIHESRTLARELGISPDEALTLLQDKTPDEIRLSKKSESMARNFKSASKWGTNPENTPVLASHMESAKSIERSSWSFKDFKLDEMEEGFSKDFLTALSKNSYALREMKSIIGMTTGAMSLDEGIASLEEIQNEKSQDPKYASSDAMEAVSKSLQKFGVETGKNLKGVSDAWGLLADDYSNLANIIASIWSKGGDQLDDFLEVATVMSKNPEALILMGAESAGSIITPVASSAAFRLAGTGLGVGAGLVLGTATNPIPLASGIGALAGGYLGGAVVGFSQYISEEMSKYVDDKGKINIRGFFSDVEKMKQVREEAARYGLTMGIFDAVFGSIAGRFVTKPLGKIKGAGLAADIAVQTAGEGVSEFGASIAAKKGDVTAEELGDIVSKSLGEMAAAGPMAGVSSTIGAGARLLDNKITVDRTKLVFSKIADRGAKAKEAISNFNKLTQLRESVNNTSMVNEFPDSAINLSKQSLQDQKAEPKTDNGDLYEGEDAVDVDSVPENVIEEEQSIHENEDDIDFVSIPADKLHQAIRELGQDPDEVMRLFGDEVYESFVKAQTSGESIEIEASEWVYNTRDMPELDTIARVNGSDLNAAEAEETLKEIEKDIKGITKEYKNIPPEGDEGVELIQDEQEEGDKEAPVLRPVNLYGIYRDQSEKRAHDTIKRLMKAATKNNRFVSKDMAEVVAEIQFRHTRNRANILGVSVEELANNIHFGELRKDDSAFKTSLGIFRQSTGFSHAWEILFRKEAKLNTLVHELGHSWLHEMGEDRHIIMGMDEANMTPEQREYREAIELAEELLGVNVSDVSSGKLSDEDNTKIHETFSQTTEKYFLEGRFENNRIRSLMEIMRRWLTRLGKIVGTSYNRLGIFALPIDDRVERMFTVLTDASNKVEEAVYPMFPEPLFPMDILGAQKDKYIENLKDAHDEAIATTYMKSFKQSLAERERMIDAALNEIYDAATRVVDQKVSMQMLKSMQDSYESFKKGETESDPRISYESMRDYLFNGNDKDASAFKKTLHISLVAGKKKGGIDIRLFMSTMGVADKIKFGDMLAEASSRDILIEQEANRIVEERFPAFKTDDEIHRIAVESVQNKGRDKLLSQELKILADQYLSSLKGLTEKVALPAEMTRRLAKDHIDGQAIKRLAEAKALHFKPERFLKESNRYGREAARMFSKGDILQAFDAKYKQAVFYQMYKQAIPLSKKVAKMRAEMKRIDRFSDRKIGKRYDVDIVGFAKLLIQTVRSGNPDIPFFSIDNLANPENITDSQVQGINDAIKSYKASMLGKNIINTPMEAFLQFGKILGMVMKTARSAKVVEINGRVFQINEIADSIVNEIGPKRKSDPKTSSKIAQSFLNIRSLFNSLIDEKNVASSSLIGIANYAMEAEALFNENFDDARAELVKAVREVIKGDKGLKGALAPLIRRMPDKLRTAMSLDSYSVNDMPIASPELGIEFKSKAELLQAILYMGSASGAEKFLIGGIQEGKSLSSYDFETGLVDEKPFWDMISRLSDEGVLTKKDFDFAQTVWDLFGKYHDKVKTAIRYTDGFEVGTIEPRAFDTKFGMYKGGYVPVTLDKDYKLQRLSEKDFSVDSEHNHVADLYPSSNIGFTKNRDNTKYPVSMDLSRISYQLANVLKVAYLRAPMYDVGKVLAHPEVKKALNSRRPEAHENMVIPWFQRTMAQQYTIPSDHPFNSIARVARQNTYVAMFFGNIKSVARQFIGVVPAMPLTGKTNMLNASKEYALNPTGMQELIKEKSSRMRQRFKNQERNKIRSWERLDLNNDWVSGTKEIVEKYTFLPIQIMQTQVDAVVWKAAYNKILKEGGTERAAISYADNAVERTQGSSNLSSMANIAHGDDLRKLFTMVSSVPLAMFGLNYEAYARATETESRSVKAAKIGAYMSMAVFTIFVPAIMSSIITDMDFDDEDEKKSKDPTGDYMKHLSLGIASETLEVALPLYSRVASMFMPYMRSGNLTPVGSMIRSLEQTKSGLTKKTQGVDMTDRQIAALMKTVTLLTGLPTSILGRGILFAEDFKTDAEKRAEGRVRQRQLRRARRED